MALGAGVALLCSEGAQGQPASRPALFLHFARADGVTKASSLGATAEMGLIGPLALTVEVSDWNSTALCAGVFPPGTCGTGGWTVLAGATARHPSVAAFARVAAGRFEGSSGRPTGRASPALLLEGGFDFPVAGIVRSRISLVHQRVFDGDFEAALGEPIRYTGVRVGVGLGG
jgi:hypothetical protein